ncbi:MAG: cytochrome c oxidase subunit II [Bacteroidia bacterium]|nr:cytochrome c oxidase subunit II [Bacteroidia bacterium]NNM15973.1 cytochrome c oxidase subunit II [Bacteroidia bacterium]
MVRLMSVLQLANKLTGNEEADVTEKDNNFNAILMMVFLVVGMVFVIYTTWRYDQFTLPIAASEHGTIVDNLMTINWYILAIVFFLTQIALFYFAFKYKHSKNRRADYYAHNDKLEIIWTIIPAIVLAFLVITGLRAWGNIMDIDKQDGTIIELYGKQFDWTARYAGPDNILGKSDAEFITPENPLGVDPSDPNGKDDRISRELYLPKGELINFEFRSRDVIHSAYMPHFRAQMNCVPGMTTRFNMTPTMSTADMKKETGNEDFRYILLCNKICGVAHYNMKMDLVVEEKVDFYVWLGSQELIFPKKTKENENAVTDTEEAEPEKRQEVELVEASL